MARTEPSSFFQRLERLEPYVANRLLLVQGGIALALAIAGRPQGTIPEVLNFLPFSLGGTIRERLAFDVGYPMRELVWAGEVWRVPIGAFLPPGLGIFLLYWMSLFPFAKSLESRLSRIKCFIVYSAGGMATVSIDLLTGSGPTSGGIGMVFSAAGALWVLERTDPRRVMESSRSIPRQNLLFLVLLGLVCVLPYWGQPELEGEMAQLGVTTLTPSLAALAAGFFVGVTLAPFLMMGADLPGGPSESSSSPTGPLLGNRTPWIASLVAGLGVLGYGVFGWFSGGRVDHALWKIEPELLADSTQANLALVKLTESYPEDHFLKKRLAVQHLRNERWSEAESILSRLKIESASWTPQAATLHHLRALRLTHLNLRDSETRIAWSYSGSSMNYQLLQEWLIVELAHLARLKGDTVNLTTLRRVALEENENLLRAKVGKKTSSDDAKSNTVFEALILNERAYLRTELDGNLAVAIEEASRSVALDVNSYNLDTLGWVQFKSGQFEEAIENLGRSLQTPESAASGTTYYHLGAAYQESGDLEKARFYFKEALRRDLLWWEFLDLQKRCPDCGM